MADFKGKWIKSTNFTTDDSVQKSMNLNIFRLLDSLESTCHITVKLTNQPSNHYGRTRGRNSRRTDRNKVSINVQTNSCKSTIDTGLYQERVDVHIKQT